MLESLGYAEAARARRGRPDPLQHVLDPRVGRQPLRRAPGGGQAAQGRGPGAGRRGRRLLVAVDEGAGVRALPVRRRRLRAGADPEARRVPDQRLADRAGLLRVRGLLRPPADEARARVPGLGADLGRLQLRAARTASCPRRAGARSSRPPGELVAEVERLAARRACARSRCSARTSTPTGATCPRGGKATFAELLADGRRRRRDRARSATRARTRRTCARTWSARTPSCDALCEHIHLPLQSGSSRVLKAMRRTYDRGRYLDRVALIREHVPDCALTTDIIVGFPGETEADFEETLEVVEEVALRLGVHVRLLAPPRDRGRRPARTSSRTRSSASAWSASSRPCSGARTSARSASSAGRWRCWSRGPRARTPTACAGAPATTRRSTSTGAARAGRARGRGDRQRDEHDARRATRAPASPRRAPR